MCQLKKGRSESSSVSSVSSGTRKTSIWPQGWRADGWHLGPPRWPPGTSRTCSQRKCRQGGPPSGSTEHPLATCQQGAAWPTAAQQLPARASPAGRGHSPDTQPVRHRFTAATGWTKAPWLRQAALEVCGTGESPQRAAPVTSSIIRKTKFKQCRKPGLLTSRGRAACLGGDGLTPSGTRGCWGRRAGQTWVLCCWFCSHEVGPGVHPPSSAAGGGAPGCASRAWVAFSSKGLLSSWARGRGWWQPLHRCCRPPTMAARK